MDRNTGAPTKAVMDPMGRTVGGITTRESTSAPSSTDAPARAEPGMRKR